MVSIIVPMTHDRGFLTQALESLVNQTYLDWELILEISNNSVGYNLNQGIKKAKGEYITYLCDDDKLPLNSLKHRVEAMKDYDFIHGYGEKFGLKSGVYELTNPTTTLKDMLILNGIMGGTTMYKAEVLKNNPFKEDLWCAEEYELHLRLLSKGYRLGFCPEILYLYRRWKGQKSLGNISPEYQHKRQQAINGIKSQYIK